MFLKDGYGTVAKLFIIVSDLMDDTMENVPLNITRNLPANDDFYTNAKTIQSIEKENMKDVLLMSFKAMIARLNNEDWTLSLMDGFEDLPELVQYRIITSLEFVDTFVNAIVSQGCNTNEINEDLKALGFNDEYVALFIEEFENNRGVFTEKYFENRHVFSGFQFHDLSWKIHQLKSCSLSVEKSELEIIMKLWYRDFNEKRDAVVISFLSKNDFYRFFNELTRLEQEVKTWMK